jgi:hypothetical protein
LPTFTSRDANEEEEEEEEDDEDVEEEEDDDEVAEEEEEEDEEEGRIAAEPSEPALGFGRPVAGSLPCALRDGRRRVRVSWCVLGVLVCVGVCW